MYSTKLLLSYTGGNKDEGSTKLSNLPLIIGVACGAVLVIAVIIILVVFHCKRSTPGGSDSRIGDAMPDEPSGSKRERYELKPTDSKKENIVLVEEKGISNQGME